MLNQAVTLFRNATESSAELGDNFSTFTIWLSNELFLYNASNLVKVECDKDLSCPDVLEKLLSTDDALKRVYVDFRQVMAGHLLHTEHLCVGCPFPYTLKYATGVIERLKETVETVLGSACQPSGTSEHSSDYLEITLIVVGVLIAFLTIATIAVIRHNSKASGSENYNALLAGDDTAPSEVGDEQSIRYVSV